MIFAPSSFDKYSAISFPTLADAYYEFDLNRTSTNLLENIKLKLSIVIYTIQSGISILKEPLDFQRY
jgi:hypothetical protein